MEEQKQVVHFQAKKGFTTAQSNEHQRDWTEKGWESANANGRIDRSRVHLNFEIVKGGNVQPVDRSRSIPQKFLDNISARGIKDPNAKHPEDPKFRTVVDFIISGSHDTLCRMAFGDQQIDYTPGVSNTGITRNPEIEDWAKDMYDVMCERFGEENILSFVVHLDERSPHIHADIIPVTPDGKISFSRVCCGPDKYEFRRRTLALHDAFAKVNEKWGLRRGDSVAVTHRKHQSTEEYRRDLSNQCSTLEREVGEKSATLSEMNWKISQAEKKIKSLNTMISNLTEDRASVEHELDEIQRALEDETTPREERASLTRQELSLEKKLELILDKLADKQVKLKLANRQLTELQQQVSEAKEEKNDLLKEIDKANKEKLELSMNKATSEALWTVVNEFKNVQPSLSQEASALFDGTFLQDMTSRGMNIIACAAVLSMGMVDQATTFAQNCGGGGGHPGSGWGKDPKEDECEWMRRCLAQSRRMMKPSGQRIKR